MELRPSKCTGNITMVIKSTPTNYARRQAIRETWASDPKFNLVFILGMHTTKDRNEVGHIKVGFESFLLRRFATGLCVGSPLGHTKVSIEV